MKLKKLEITNFRCFESLAIDLDEQLTVLVAKNGQGKSSVLDAIRIGLWSFVSGFDLARNPGNETGNNISIDDVRRTRTKHDSTIRHDQAARYDQMAPQFPGQIALQGNFVKNIPLPFTDKLIESRASPFPDNAREIGLVWTRFRESEAKGAKTKTIFGVKTKTILGAKARLDTSALHVHHIAIALQEHIRNPESLDTDLPIIGYYGTGRLWNQKRLTERKSKQGTDFYMRLFGYRDCLDPASSYKHFADWFTWIFECYREQQLNDKEKGVQEGASVWKDTIQIIQDVTNTLLQETGWHSLEYSVSHGKTLILKHDEHGTLKVELLSDGIRNVLGLIGDIAYRCIKLNPHLGLNAAKEARGVVMIDEVEMHLHPAWQQTILDNLCKAFPTIQFIVTTHSPQVISTVPSHQIRILAENQVISADPGTQGAEASRILNEVFGVELRAQNLEIVQKLNRYLELIDDDKWDTEEALTLRQALDEWSRGNEPELVKADIDIRMKAFQRQL